MDKRSFKKLHGRAQQAAEGLKALAHELRLLIVCYIGRGECSVAELEAELGTSQSNISQHLGKLRDRQILQCRKEGNQVFYRVKDPTILELVSVLQKLYCG